jgi:hypothetical protein
MTTVPGNPDAGSAASAAIQPTVRARVREAIEAAWAQAVASGALPAVPDDQESPGVEVQRPAKPEHGDLATNLAMKLARPLRRPPLAIAEAIVAALGGEGGRGPWRTDRLRGRGRARVHQPASL